ncbi:hypothetical protein CVT25_007672 [Psilocybe cyanescens]|uniref:NB-ARC domain-containing protein n=1 Tax=Psilocybe cyanescens TaxID=93625 RepID=A0A409X191_PSICY|nr:hypothetical protein CVT25_007672 [Psilocybe cyanescens]
MVITQAQQEEGREDIASSAALPNQQYKLVCNISFLPVVAVFVAAVVAFKVSSGDHKIDPSGRLPLLPPALKIYGREEFLQEAIEKILLQLVSKVEANKHIPIKGGPGVGKTTTAIGIIHDPRIVKYFGDARHWVSCREASDIADNMKAQKLLDYISDSLGLDLTASSDRRKDIRYFLVNNNVPRIIVLDNFETMWEPPGAREATEGILKFLVQFTQLTLVITTRNAHNPATHLGVSWHQFESIQPLSLHASRMLFTSLSPPTSIDSRLDDLLRAVDCIPLPIVLMASSAQENYTTSRILEIWNSGLSGQSKALPHNNDGNPMNILDHSIALSLKSPLIKSYPEAPMLLRIIADLPGGIKPENLQRIVPLIDDVDHLAAVLVRTSLLKNSPDALQMHSTIRSHVLRNYALDASHKKNVQAFYFQLIHEAGNDPGTQDFLGHARRLSDEEANAQNLLLDALEHNLSGDTVWIAIDYFNYLLWNPPSTDIAKRTVELLKNQLLCSEGVRTSTMRQTEVSWQYTPLLKEHSWEDLNQRINTISAQISNNNMTEGGTHQFGTPDGDICQQQQTLDLLLPHVLLRLGTLYYRLDRYTEAIETLEEAADRFEKLNQTTEVAQAWNQLAEIHRLRGYFTQALQMYFEAYKRFQGAGDARRMSASQRGMGIVYFEQNRFSDALEMIEMAQRTCLPDDHTCITDSKRELGRVYRNHNQSESIRLLTNARKYYLIHGPLRHATIALYQEAIAHYLQGEYDDAEVRFSVTFEEFRTQRNDAQMGFCIYYLADMNQIRRSHYQALALFHRSETMFEHMENKFMTGLSIKGQAELYAKLCQPAKAKQAYSRAHALLEDVNAEVAIAMELDIQHIHDMCELSIWERYAALKLFLGFLAFAILFFIFIRRWSRH